MEIRHEPERKRFVSTVEGHEAVLEYAERGAGVLDYRHTFTPPELRGRGIAKQIVSFALDYAREQGLRIVPTCPYVARIVKENPEYSDLVAGRD